MHFHTPKLVTNTRMSMKAPTTKKRHFSDYLFRLLKGLKSVANSLIIEIATKIMLQKPCWQTH